MIRRRISALAAAAMVLSVAAHAEQPGRRPSSAPVFGVVALDVYASGSTIDLLSAHDDGTDKRLEHRRSVDGGASWGPAHVIDLGDAPLGVARRGNGPQIASHGDHIAVHWSTPGVDRHGAGPMATAYSADGGLTWRHGPNPAEDGTKRAQNFADMAADPSGTFYVAWIGSHDGPARRALGLARSTDFGASWEFSELIDTTACACCWNRIVAPRPGVARVLYRDHGIRDMALASTDDGGETWSLDVTVGEFGWAFDGCPHVGGGIAASDDTPDAELHALVWTGHESKHGLYWVTSHDDGASWSTPHRMGGELARHADLAATGDTVVAAWDESRGIWVSTTLDAGATWGTPRRLSSEDVVASHPLVVSVGDSHVVFWTERDAGNELHWRSQRLTKSAAATETGDNGDG